MLKWNYKHFLQNEKTTKEKMKIVSYICFLAIGGAETTRIFDVLAKTLTNDSLPPTEEA